MRASVYVALFDLLRWPPPQSSMIMYILRWKNTTAFMWMMFGWSRVRRSSISFFSARRSSRETRPT